MKFAKLSIIATMLFGSVAFAQGHNHGGSAGPVISIKAAELAAHRIGRLVKLKKISASFEKQLVSVHVSAIQENGAAFKVEGETAAEADGKSSVVTVFVSDKGTHVGEPALSKRNSPPANPANWTEADALSLIEKGMHFVIDGGNEHPEIKPFYNGFQQITLMPVKNAAGIITSAKLSVFSTQDSRILVINMTPGADFINYEIGSGL